MKNLKESFTKIFLKQANIAISEATIKIHMHDWWQNKRKKEEGGLRLTENGFKFLTEQLDLKFYQVSLPKNIKITTQTIIFLDQFIDCPYFLTENYIFVTNEKKSMELFLFSGDLQKYGLTKAMSRYN